LCEKVLSAAKTKRSSPRGAARGVFLASLLLTAASSEAAVKAAYLSRLPPFVQWPESAFDSPAGPLNICVVGADPFGATLDRMVSGQHVGQHPVEIKRLPRFDKGSACHVLYLGALKAPEVAQVLAAARGAPVLTVTDGQSTEDPKGVVDFQSHGQRVRLAVDGAAAEANGLVVSSKLLSLGDTGEGAKAGVGP
jgi:hypothetical protein